MNSLLKQATQRTLGVTRSGLRLSQRLGRRVASDAFGLVQQVRHLRREPKVGMDESCIVESDHPQSWKTYKFRLAEKHFW